MFVLNEILENKKNIEHLSEALYRGKLSHAYIINGPKGSGKRKFTDFIAAGLLCDKTHEDEDDQNSFSFLMGGQKAPLRRLSDGPCGTCPACAKSLSGNHPDIIYLKREKPKVIQVKEIREQIIDDIRVKPYYGPYKIYIIENAELMTESSQNAILKTIEEPPEYAVIFLLSENADEFLDTIRSRCIRLDMERLPDDLIRNVLKEKLDVSKEDAARYSAFARGNLGKALDLAMEDGENAFIGSVTECLQRIPKMSAADISEEAAEFGKEDPSQLLQIVRMWFRDILILKADGTEESEIYFPGEKTFLKNMAQKISYEGLNNIMIETDTAEKRLEANVKAEAVLENLFLGIRRNSR